MNINKQKTNKQNFKCSNINVVLKNFNIFHQYLSASNQFLVCSAYLNLADKQKRTKRSKNELEKSFEKL